MVKKKTPYTPIGHKHEFQNESAAIAAGLTQEGKDKFFPTPTQEFGKNCKAVWDAALGQVKNVCGIKGGKIRTKRRKVRRNKNKSKRLRKKQRKTKRKYKKRKN